MEIKTQNKKHSALRLVILLIVIAAVGVSSFFVGRFMSRGNPAAAPGNTAPPGFGAISDTALPTGGPHETPEAKKLTVYAIDVGQGDAFLLVSPNGKTMMIDSGEAREADKVKAFICSKGISGLDVVVATHPHSDHIGSFPELFNEFKVGKLLMPDIKADTAVYKDFMKSVKAHRIAYYTVWSGDTVEWDDECRVTILAPVEGIEYSSRDMNEWSIIMRVEYKNTSMLFTGDAEARSEQAAMLFNGKELLDADILKVCHHGSVYSSTTGFLEAVSPEYAIISVGEGNRYGHPDFDTLLKLKLLGAEIYRTDLNGDITLILDGETVEVITEK